jgi:hypothetical protein
LSLPAEGRRSLEKLNLSAEGWKIQLIPAKRFLSSVFTINFNKKNWV